MEHSRCDDTSSVKRSITQYLLFDTTEALDPPISPGEKIGRGWSHPVTAALLCPLEYPATDRYASNSLSFSMSHQPHAVPMQTYNPVENPSPASYSHGSCTQMIKSTTRTILRTASSVDIWWLGWVSWLVFFSILTPFSRRLLNTSSPALSLPSKHLAITAVAVEMRLSTEWQKWRLGLLPMSLYRYVALMYQCIELTRSTDKVCIVFSTRMEPYRWQIRLLCILLEHCRAFRRQRWERTIGTLQLVSSNHRDLLRLLTFSIL